jgi:RNA polymerase sigma factor (sigma-70 family)
MMVVGFRECGMPPIDPTMLGRLYREHAPALLLYARQWADTAEDLVQDAFVRLAQQKCQPANVVPWLYRVIRNQAFTNRRSDIRRRRREALTVQEASWFSTVDDQLEALEATRHLAELSLELREIIVARLGGGLTFAEVAELVGCSLPTAQRRYQAGLAELRERLEGRWNPIHRTPTI